MRTRNWRAALLEFVLIALGILMAFQVDRWWEHRNDRQLEREYIIRLSSDLKRDVENLSSAVSRAELRKSFAALLMDVSENPALARENPVDFVLAVNQAAYTYTPSLTSNTFEELKSTGRLRLLEDADLRNQLFDYYRYDVDQRQYLQLQLMQELRHFELAAGILPHALLRKIAVDFGIVRAESMHEIRQYQVNMAQLDEAVTRMQERTDFIAWLPIAYEMQIEIADVNSARRDRAKRLLDRLNLSLERGL